MTKKDRYLPPIRPIPQKDRYTPSSEEEAKSVSVPEVIPTEPQIESIQSVMSDLLGMPFKLPQGKNAVLTYLLTLPQRLKLRGHQKLAEKMGATLQSIHDAQAAKLALCKILIEEHYLVAIQKAEYETQLAELDARRAEAIKRKRLAEED